MPLVSTRRLGWSSRRNGLLFHSFVSVPPLPPFLSLSLFVIVAPARRSNTPLPCYGSRTPTHPGPFLFPCKSISLFRASSPRLPRLVAPLVIESATRRYAAQGFAACVDRVGVLVCEFRGIVSVEHFPARIGTRGIGSLGARMDRDPLCSRLSRALSARVVSLRRLCGSSVCGRRVTEPPDLFFEPWRASVRERYIRDPSSMCRFKLCATIDRVYWSYLETSWFFRRIKMLKFFNRQIDILVLFKMADLSNISSFVINIFPYFVAKVINIFRQFLYEQPDFVYPRDNRSLIDYSAYQVYTMRIDRIPEGA